MATVAVAFRNLGIGPAFTGPYPPWRSELLELIERALSIAWDSVRTRYPRLLAQADEDRITEQIKTELVALRTKNEPQGFNSDLFGMPTRDSKLRDWLGKSIDKTPDLTIYLAHPRPGVIDAQYDAIFLECKVLDARRGLRAYRKDGIERFLDGRYAWAMPHAGMIGYVLGRKANCPLSALTAYLSRRCGRRTIGAILGVVSPPSKVATSPRPSAADVAETIHKRSAPLVRGKATQISLRHLWLLR